MSQNHYNEPGGLVNGVSDSYDDNSMDYAETPIHPLAAAPSSNLTSSSPHASRPPLPSNHREESYQTSSTPSFQPQQHQQLLKLKNEHGCSTPVSNSEAKDDESYDHPNSPSIPQRSSMGDDASPRFSPSPAQEKNHLVVDTSSTGGPLRSPHMLMPETMGTPTTPSTATMTPDTSAPLSGTTNSSAATSSSSRRGSLRTTTATLPRTALQEETVALFKKYKSLIPCAKCFNRDTIQRDGMSDGNLRFKCRPPVSMSLICNKSYSESKIRNMIAGVVYGYTLPDSGTPTSGATDGSKSNVLAFPPPPMPTSTAKSRRASQKPVDMSSQNSGERLDQEDSRDQQMLEQDHRQRLQQQHHRQEDVRRASMQQSQFRRPSAAGDDSPMMDYDDSTMLPPLGRPNRLQVPGTPPLDDDRSHSYNRGPSNLVSSTRQPQKLHHSRSHPNIGQQRQQQYMDHQDQMSGEHRGSIGGYKSSPHGHPYPHSMRPQAIRRESAPYSSTERRFSYPSQKSSSSTSGSKFLPVGHTDEALSPALSSSSRSSPGREPVLQPLSSSGAVGDHDQNPGTPSLGSLPQGYYGDNKGSSSPYQRRMSQPHPNQPRGSGSSAYTQLPGFSGVPSANKQPLHYDRRGSEMDEYHYSHREKYEKLNANTLKQYKSRVPYGQESPFMPSSASSASHQSPQFENSSLSVFSSSTPAVNRASNGGYSPLSGYSSLPQGTRPAQSYQSSSRRDYAESDTYAPDSDQPEDFESRQYAKMRGIKHPANNRPQGNHLYNVPSSSGPKDLDSVLPKNTIKLTCFPSSVKSQPDPSPSSTTSSLETTDAMALNLDQNSKLVIEISQPRLLQSFRSLTSLRASSSSQPRDRVIRHAISQPNLLRSSSSVLGLRRSASPDSMSFGSSKKRRADSVFDGGREMEDMTPAMSKMSSSSSSSAAATAAAAVVAAAAASAAASSSGANLQFIGTDYPAKEGLGLGLSSSSSCSSPAIEALAVARASSYVPLEEQKEMGIDYSLFTRVETAGWRILIPPNVTAAFRSEDFGLLLKPKSDGEETKEGLEPLDMVDQEAVEGGAKGSKDGREVSESIRANEGEEKKAMAAVVQTEAAMEASSPVGGHKELPVSSAVDGGVAPAGSVEGMEIEEEMDELEDD
ncbi:hypothetical protein BGZ81_006496 [Podila clonocystis]|nr:hypothetical protein BGZ81_006496 [Podila clonocystis]